MKIELRRISYNARLSHETSAFAADVWVDGVKRGTVENDGHGGADLIRPGSLADEIRVYCKTLPPVDHAFGPLPQSPELLFGELLDTWLAERDLKRLFKKKLVFVRDGKLFQANLPGHSVPFDPQMVVLNTLPFDEALKLFVKLAKAR
jgi:hypothetical protein